MDSKTMELIMREVSLGIPPERSRVRPSPEARKFRESVERGLAAARRRNPRATLDVPADL